MTDKDKIILHPGTPHRELVAGIPCADADLAEGKGGLNADATKAIFSLMHRIPGVVFRWAEAERKAERTVLIRLCIDGWSPSMHRIMANYEREAPCDAHGDVRPDDADGAFSDVAQEHIRRAYAGVHMGIFAPLPLDEMDSNRGRMKGRPVLRHLLVDAALPAAAAAGGVDLATALAEAVVAMHEPAKPWEGGAYLLGTGSAALECGLGRLITHDVWFPTPLGEASYDGMRLRLPGIKLAETAMTQCVGRPLRDVVSILPEMDGRIIKSAEMSGNMFEVSFEHVLTEVSRIPPYQAKKEC